MLALYRRDVVLHVVLQPCVRASVRVRVYACLSLCMCLCVKQHGRVERFSQTARAPFFLRFQPELSNKHNTSLRALRVLTTCDERAAAECVCLCTAVCSC